MLRALTEQRRQAPGRALSLEALLEAGWPGERLRGRSGASRVYVAVATLRRLGLGGTLRRTDDGYLLDPNVPTYENYRLELRFKLEDTAE